MDTTFFNSRADQYSCESRQDSLFPWLEDVFRDAKTNVHILIVADGSLTFIEAEFGLSEFLNKGISSKVPSWMNLKVVKAHRSEGAAGADICGFRFDETPAPPHDHPLDYYDEIWLFGQESETVNCKPNPIRLTRRELTALAKFMNGGGGVFATGDHEDLGAALCGEVPRVRSMRKWFMKDKPPPRDTEERLDTLREGFDQGFLVNDQSDRIPQEIRPIFKLNATGTASCPHEILRDPRRLAIQVLPDHMHEGECTIPTNLKSEIKLEDGTVIKEYPMKEEKQVPISPEVVALATSVGGFIPQLPKPAPPVNPRIFPIIVAYDGHQAGKASKKSVRDGVGRVVVDASFHHFVDVNLRGTGSGDDRKKGLYDFLGRPTRDYEAIKQYYRNMRRWLLRPEKQQHYYLNMLLASRYLSPLNEEIRFVKNPRLHDLLFAGKAAYQAISDRFSMTDAMHCAYFAAGTVSEDLRKQTEMLLEPWSANPITVSPALRIFNLNFVPEVLLGGAMLGIAKQLPENPYDIQRQFPESNQRVAHIRESVATELFEAGKTLMNEIPGSQKLFKHFLGMLNG